MGSFQTVFRTSQRELRETSDLAVEEAGMNHAITVRDVVAGLHEALQQEQTQTKKLTSVQAPVDHVANAVQSTQQHLATQLHQMKLMMQTMQMN